MNGYTFSNLFSNAERTSSKKKRYSNRSVVQFIIHMSGDTSLADMYFGDMSVLEGTAPLLESSCIKDIQITCYGMYKIYINKNVN